MKGRKPTPWTAPRTMILSRALTPTPRITPRQRSPIRGDHTLESIRFGCSHVARYRCPLWQAGMAKQRDFSWRLGRLEALLVRCARASGSSWRDPKDRNYLGPVLVLNPDTVWC